MENKIRCQWCVGDELYEKYHDTEWGVAAYDDKTLFEFLILESFQAGLSWITILRKRENFRQAFDNFSYKKIAKYKENKVSELMQNVGIIRSELKIRSAISNAIAFMKIQEEFGTFSKYLWSIASGRPMINYPETLEDVPASTPLSEALSKDLKKRGFKFVGPTTVYAYMQAVGVVNDHVADCFTRKLPVFK